VSTIAGSATITGLLDGSATAARFNHLTDITTDGTNFYITDYLNSAIRKMNPAGVVTTMACTDVDTGGSIIFNHPTSITTDGTNLYVVDSGNNMIRFIEISSNKVTTIGSTTALAGSIDSVVKTDVRFNQPTGITTDGVNLYVTDSGNNTVRRIVIATTAVTTLAGAANNAGSTDGIQAAARFNSPARITTNGIDLYLTDFNNRTIRRISIATGAVTTIAGITGPLDKDDGTADGIGTAAHFNQPNGITTDGTNLYVTDSYQNTIRKIVIATGAVTTISGIPRFSGDMALGQGGSADSPDTPSFYTPIGITTDGSSLFVADSYNNTIRKIQ
jgi:DNA-binding beta-propeller fold protein YncE